MSQPKPKRQTTHPDRADRRKRAIELQKRMANHPQSVAQREASRGYPAKLNAQAK